MCLSRQATTRRWNWDGDEIDHDTVVPSSRPVPGREKAGGYPIDVREFLVTENNAVVRLALANEIAPAADRDADRFRTRAAGAFDFRADVIRRWVAENIHYERDRDLPAGRKSSLNVWQFPDETLHVRAGDCEDRALLLASLLLASGISAYNVRVALGRIVFRRDGEELDAFDHVWVVYKRENGQWDILEPVTPTRPKRGSPASARSELLTAAFEYEPQFLFNIDHLWRIQETARKKSFSKAVARRREWERIRPAFAGDVHWSIIDQALHAWGKQTVDGVRRTFTTILGRDIDALDFPHRYDPTDHFDNCMIDEGWKRVAERLSSFAKTRDLEAFGNAAHGIADFYAHSSYGSFAQPANGRFESFDPAWIGNLDAHLGTPVRYDVPPFDLVSGPFSRGPLWGKRPGAEAAKLWNGKLISGRYGHDDDSGSIFEGFTWIPKRIWRRPDFWKCAGAPHHEEMAVDNKTGKNKLFDRTAYESQFKLREATAVVHIRAEFAKVIPLPQ